MLVFVLPAVYLLGTSFAALLLFGLMLSDAVWWYWWARPVMGLTFSQTVLVSASYLTGQ